MNSPKQTNWSIVKCIYYLSVSKNVALLHEIEFSYVGVTCVSNL